MSKYDFVIFYAGGGIRFFTTYADALAEATTLAEAFAEMNRRKYKGCPAWTVQQIGGLTNEAEQR